MPFSTQVYKFNAGAMDSMIPTIDELKKTPHILLVASWYRNRDKQQQQQQQQQQRFIYSGRLIHIYEENYNNLEKRYAFEVDKHGAFELFPAPPPSPFTGKTK